MDAVAKIAAVDEELLPLNGARSALRLNVEHRDFFNGV
jgi:hypothetical protein